MKRKIQRGNSVRRSLGMEQLESREMFAVDVPSTMRQALDLGVVSPKALVKAEAVNPADDVDMFRIRVVAGQRVGIDIDTKTNGPPGLGSYLRLFDRKGNELAANNDRLAPGDPPPGAGSNGIGFDSYVEYGFKTSGVYFVGVSNWQHRYYDPVTGQTALGTDPNWLTGAYKLFIKEVNPDPDDQFTEAHNLRAILPRTIKRTDSISVPWDVDMFRFTVTAGQRVGFDIDTNENGVGGLGSYLRIFTSSGKEIAANNDAVAPDDPTGLGFDAYIEHTFRKAGTYYVGVSNWQNTRYDPKSGADVLGSSSSYLTGRYSLVIRDYTHFVSKVPDIMGNLGWSVAQKLQQKWFNAKARTAGTNALPADSSTVKMDWTLTYSRAQNAYNDLLQNYDNAAAMAELKSQLEAQFAATSATTINFGDFTKKGAALHAQHINYRSVSTYGLDELTGALGNYSYYVIPKGTATKTANGIEVTITDIGVYLRDSYDFNGDQQLGYWKVPNGVSAVPFSGYTSVTNADYRDYRAATGKGGDFIIYSDVKVTHFAQPNQFTL